MLAIAVVPLLHTPPVVRSFKALVAPGHTDSVPVILKGRELTVTVIWVLQPVDVAVNVMVGVPGAAPVTMPEVEPIVAIDVLLLLHVPGALRNTVVDPAHIVVIPLIAAGIALTVTVVLVAHPVPIE